jgi:putative phosphoribosyl transferase
MAFPFLNRQDAGRQLADRLLNLVGRSDVVVLGLPRGGVPVAAEVAEALKAPLDVFLVRKLGVPGHEEFAMGAIASGGVRVLNPGVIQALNISREAVEAVTRAEQQKLALGDREYRMDRPFPVLKGMTVLLVDDGAATGSTLLAAIHALRQHQPAAIIAAAPVMSESAWHALGRVADRCAAVHVPEPFRAVGEWYHNFEQTSDEEVRAALQQAASGDVEKRYAARN